MTTHLITLADGLRGQTPNELAPVLRLSPDRIRAMIRTGELGAIDTARHRCGRPRYVVLPHHLAEYIRSHSAAEPTPGPRRKRAPTGSVDYYPDGSGE